MKLAPFLLEQWVATYSQSARFYFAGSTGPMWKLADLVALMTSAERDAFDHAELAYCPGRGRESLRVAIASMYAADPEEILVFSGSSEALLALFFVASEPDANVVVPSPSFAPFYQIPESLGLETRRYVLLQERHFVLDVDRIKDLVDDRTKLILLNSPHNPSGAVIEEDQIRELDKFASERGIQLVVDEVFHPIYQGKIARSVGEYSRASVLGDFSKAFSLPALRLGWMLERSAERRAALKNAHEHFMVSSSILSELLAEVAVRNRETIWDRARSISATNLAVLDEWCTVHEERVEWTRPRGSMTAFPRLRGSHDSRPFCVAAANHGVLMVPGDCFGAPAHFRIGFGLANPHYGEAARCAVRTAWLTIDERRPNARMTQAVAAAISYVGTLHSWRSASIGATADALRAGP